jgi:hypothetical protein
VALGIHYDDSLSQTSFSYDDDVTDHTPALAFGPFPYTETFTDVHTTSLFFTAVLTGTSTGLIDHWSMLPLSDVVGDFNGNDVLDAADIDELSAQLRAGTSDLRYDLNSDAAVDDLDRQAWVHDLKSTYFGDGDLSGTFDSTDLVQVLAFGEYEDDVELNSTWLTGDWNGDGEFTSGDLVTALADGRYEAGAAAVPEPAGIVLAMAASALVATYSRWRPRTRRE